MKLKAKILLKLIKEYLGFWLNCLIMLLIAIAFDKFFAMLLFILFTGVIKSCFKIEFHADSLFENEPIKALKYCKFISIFVEIIYLIVSSKLKLTIYSNVFIILSFALFNSILEVALETIVIMKNKKQLILSFVENNEKKIEKYCKRLGIGELAETVYFYLNNTTEETAEWLGIDTSTVKRRINKFIKISKAS